MDTCQTVIGADMTLHQIFDEILTVGSSLSLSEL
jgi:hypothetical protein